MTDVPATEPENSADPTLEVAERQLAMLRRLGQIALEVSEAFACSAKASGKAEEMILADEFFMPEVGRARACGAKDAAESFQKASRALRLTVILEMNVAEIVRDIRAGKLTYIGGIAHRKDAGETPADLEASLVRRRPAGFSLDTRDRDPRSRDSNTERLVDFERPESLPRAPVRASVDHVGAELGVAIDWSTWTVGRPAPENPPARPSPPGCGETGPPDSRPGCALLEPEARPAALSP